MNLKATLTTLILTTSLLTGCVQETSGLRFNEGKGCWEPRSVEVPYSNSCDEGGGIHRDPDDGLIWSFDTSCIPDRFVEVTLEEVEPIIHKPKCYELE